MSYMCDICGKRPTVGNNVSHANNHTKRRWKPNLRKVRAVTPGFRPLYPGVHPVFTVGQGNQTGLKQFGSFSSP